MLTAFIHAICQVDRKNPKQLLENNTLDIGAEIGITPDFEP